MSGRPLVLGHRGASAVAPENTVAAFTRARELGADGVELDVRCTADGVLVVHHDPEIHDVGLIASLSFAALRAARPQLATLAEALEACHGLVVNAEVKCLPWEPDADVDGSVMRATIDAVRAHDGMMVVSSFDLAAVDRARAVAPDLATAWLTHGQAVVAAAEIAAAHGHPWLNADGGAALEAGADGIALAHRAGVLVGTWTVDDPEAARTLGAAGADIIITNVPDVVLEAVTQS
ncbi:MAG TPA: glycerophosphodiester phosphodiesterase [Acidimicrobiia bacterium]|nr:glycerophosphodiester phosphodiesterase [Acidimicrobiia bacterium]